MSNGLYDISYHYVIDSEGNIYEGRDIGARGAHVLGNPGSGNTGRIGILWLGVSDSTGGPSEQQVQATMELINTLNTNYGIDSIYGHRELDATSCPGDPGMSFVNQIREWFFR
jgi:N-acetylmuramoyl-L-alanine amidase